eukprot:CFRG8464T1
MVRSMLAVCLAANILWLSVSDAGKAPVRGRCDIVDARKKDCGFFGITELECKKKGCCWKESYSAGVAWCYNKLAVTPPPVPKPKPVIPHRSMTVEKCSVVEVRSDCGYTGINDKLCEAKGCCWAKGRKGKRFRGEPWCFYKATPKNDEWHVTSAQTVLNGVNLLMEYKGNEAESRTQFGRKIRRLSFTATYEDYTRLHIKITDKDNERWEIPVEVQPIPGISLNTEKQKKSNEFRLLHAEPGETFWFKVIRKRTAEVLFNTENLDFEFANQYIELSTHLPKDNYLYGLGERVDDFRLQPNTYGFHAFDYGCPLHTNLYGSHPVYLDVRQKSGNVHLVYLRNSNAMDVVLEEETLTYKVTGGILDLYFVLGPTFESATHQYANIIGKPHLPPFWGLGYHQSRWGYKNVDMLRETIQRFRLAGIPLDVIWSDIDYMEQKKSWSWSKENFTKSAIQSFVEDIHDLGLHYVTVVDPGIKQENGYDVYQTGKEKDVFLKRYDGQEFQGKVWPGLVAYPDFFNPVTGDWWIENIANFLSPRREDTVHVDGLWVDMNELSNFCNGPCNAEIDRDLRIVHRAREFMPNNPPYRINNNGRRLNLEERTVSMDALHYGDVYEYDVHNLFGHMEANVTKHGLEQARGKRSFIISRSTFPGTGAVAGHWTGDNNSTWEDMRRSIPALLNFNLFQIPLVGADICGFLDTTEEELCARWTALGSFYPFSRNHNAEWGMPQEPFIWASVTEVAKKYLGLRYMLSAYYYTLFHSVNKMGGTVIRPLFFDNPTNVMALNNDRQFMVGDGILVSPVLHKGHDFVNAYFPPGLWFDLLSPNTRVDVPTSGGVKRISAPIIGNTIATHVKGGTILPLYTEPASTILETRDNSDIALMIVLDGEGYAKGSLYLDDGDSIDVLDSVEVHFMAYDGRLKIKARRNGLPCTKEASEEKTNMNPTLSKIIILGDIIVQPNSRVDPSIWIVGRKDPIPLMVVGSTWVATDVHLPICSDNIIIWQGLKHMLDLAAGKKYTESVYFQDKPQSSWVPAQLSDLKNSLLLPGKELFWLISVATVVTIFLLSTTSLVA